MAAPGTDLSLRPLSAPRRQPVIVRSPTMNDLQDRSRRGRCPPMVSLPVDHHAGRGGRAEAPRIDDRAREQLVSTAGRIAGAGGTRMSSRSTSRPAMWFTAVAISLSSPEVLRPVDVEADADHDRDLVIRGPVRFREDAGELAVWGRTVARPHQVVRPPEGEDGSRWASLTASDAAAPWPSELTPAARRVAGRAPSNNEAPGGATP